MKHHRVLIAGLLLVSAAAACASGVAETRHQSALGTELLHLLPAVAEAMAGLAWAGMGALLAWLRPRNVLGWIILAVGTLTQLGLAEENLANAGFFGVLDPANPWVRGTPVLLLSMVTGFAIYVMLGLLPVLYPSGRWPGCAWLLPSVMVVAGAGLLQFQWVMDALHAGSAGARILVAPPWLPALLFGAGLLAVWGMSVVRLVRARQPERSQLAWLLATVVALLATQFLGASIPGHWLRALCLYLFPAAIAVGMLRYRLLGIQAVLRRGLVYGVLTAAIIGIHALVLAAAGLHLTRDPLAAISAAVLVAVGLSPLRNRLQQVVDAVLYGRGADPLAALSQWGTLGAGTPEHELLHVLLDGVREAVRSPGVRILKPDGGTLATAGGPAAAGGPSAMHTPLSTAMPSFSTALALGGRSLGTLEVDGRTPGERYPSRDQRMLRAMAAQLAAVVHAMALTEQLQEQRDAVVNATARERERLRRDLHDGLGPSLTGVGLGLQALGDSLAPEQQGPRELLTVLHREVGSAVGEVRRILEDLVPAALAGAELAAVLPQRVAAVAGQLHHTVHIDALPPLTQAVAEAVYNITSEAVANVAKHASACHVEVRVDVLGGRQGPVLAVSVDDDGTGFAPDAAAGIGLASMRERAVALGGNLSVDSGPGGTSVSLTLPLPLPLPLKPASQMPAGPVHSAATPQEVTP